MEQAPINKFYVYLHVRLDGRVFYVGKGQKNRAYSLQRNRYWNNLVNKIKKYKIEIITKDLSELDSLILEEKLISYYKNLGQAECNILPGGYLNSGKNNPMYGKGYLLKGHRNGMYGKTGKMKGRIGVKHPKFGKVESKESRLRKTMCKLGSKHWKHRWNYNTPKGTFKSITEASIENQVSIATVKGRCRSKNYKNWTKCESRQ